MSTSDWVSLGADIYNLREQLNDCSGIIGTIWFNVARADDQSSIR
jgi:hypothetical protein